MLQIIRNSSLNLAVNMLAALRLQSALAARIRKKKQLVILNLHRVSPDDNAFYPAIHPHVFEDFLHQITKLLRVFSLSDLRKGEVSEGGIILSFDDGYRDFLEFAVPILSFYKIRANQNVVPQCVLSGKPIWNVLLYDRLNAASPGQINELRIPGFCRRLSSRDSHSKLLFAASLSHFLKMRPRVERQRLWQHVEEWMLQIPCQQLTAVLSLDEIRGLLPDHDIGAHSFTHESMEFESVEFFQDDLSKCQDFFQEELRMPLSIYAFPNGSYRPEQLSILRSKNLDFVLLVGEKLATVAQTVLPRITFSPQTLAQAKLYAVGFRRKRIS